MLVAQNATLSLWEENLEQLSADEEERNWEDELETLSARLQEPVNINAATKRQLEEFPFLTDIQIENILAYVYINGQMQTLYELQLVKEMDRQTIELLLPFVCIKTVKDPSRYPSLKTVLKYAGQEVLTRLDIPLYTRKGYEKNYPAKRKRLVSGYGSCSLGALEVFRFFGYVLFPLVEVSYQQGFAGNRRNVSGYLFSAEKLIAISQLPV